MHLSEKTEKIGIGLMSGTSLDGIDAALVKISGFGTSTAIDPIRLESIPYDTAMRKMLLKLCDPKRANIQMICEMNFLLGRMFAEAVDQVIGSSGLSKEDVDFISSHGQTVFHIPPNHEPDQTPSTLQIGDLSVIAQRTGIPAIGDFRTADMAAGGHGAPLVPYADYVLFRSENEGRAIQNIGGIGNVTFLPANAKANEVIAFDTGPGNMVIDQMVERVTCGEKAYDAGGMMAAKGQVADQLLDQWLLKDSYFMKEPPKSTGRERYGQAFANQVFNEASSLSANDLIATVTALTARSITDSYQDFIMDDHQLDEVIIGGGGAKNHTLIKMIREQLPGVRVSTHEEHGVDSKFKEAIAFAILANEWIHGNSNNLPSATGASRPVRMGKLACP